MVIVGLAALIVGGEALVRGSTRLAGRLGISPTVVGLTVVAAGTSMPELVVSIKAAVSGSTELAVGNVVGSNIFNIGAILGIAALVAPLRIVGNTVKLEWPVMVLASGLLFLLARDGGIDRVEGGFFVVGLVVFVAYVVHIARGSVTEVVAEQLSDSIPGLHLVPPPSWASCLGLIALGAAILAAGAHALVVGAVDIASGLGVSKTIIGLTVVSAGTSMPELAASVVASRRGHDDIAVANVVGSNIFNILAIGGTTALVHPLPVVDSVLESDVLWMLGFSLLLFPLMRTGLRVTRIEGALLLGLFATYMTFLLL